MPIDVKYYIPGSSSGWLIRQVETIHYDGMVSLNDRFVPRADVAFVFHFHDTPVILEPEPVRLPSFFIAPLLRKSVRLEVEHGLDTMIIVCNPSVLSRSFNIDLSPVPGLNINLDYKIFYPLWAKMRDLPGTEERIACFSEFINEIQDVPYVEDIIDIVFSNIIERSISQPLSEIFESLCINERTLQRHFIKRVGVGPKLLARIARVNYLWDQIEKNKSKDYQDLVFFGNYYDQTHFIKDFKDIIGETPSSFFKRNLGMVKMLSGK